MFVAIEETVVSLKNPTPTSRNLLSLYWVSGPVLIVFLLQIPKLLGNFFETPALIDAPAGGSVAEVELELVEDAVEDAVDVLELDDDVAGAAGVETLELVAVAEPVDGEPLPPEPELPPQPASANAATGSATTNKA